MSGVQKLYSDAGGKGTIPSINFQHIPVNGYKDNMDNPQFYIMGENNEDSYHVKKNTGWFTALKEFSLDMTMTTIKLSSLTAFTWAMACSRVGLRDMRKIPKKADCLLL